MRQKKNYMILTFKTTTAAMAMEKKCSEEGIPGRLIPLPLLEQILQYCAAQGAHLFLDIQRQDYVLGYSGGTNCRSADIKQKNTG